jgi:hypothetical protein
MCFSWFSEPENEKVASLFFIVISQFMSYYVVVFLYVITLKSQYEIVSLCVEFDALIIVFHLPKFLFLSHDPSLLHKNLLPARHQ